jgi:hypothetical protein
VEAASVQPSPRRRVYLHGQRADASTTMMILRRRSD